MVLCKHYYHKPLTVKRSLCAASLSLSLRGRKFINYVSLKCSLELMVGGDRTPNLSRCSWGLRGPTCVPEAAYRVSLQLHQVPLCAPQWFGLNGKVAVMSFMDRNLAVDIVRGAMELLPSHVYSKRIREIEPRYKTPNKFRAIYAFTGRI
jgi:hypothetical protein